MKKVSVFRVENSRGWGPYQSEFYPDEYAGDLTDMAYDHNKYPTPFYDGFEAFSEEHFCGFLSVDHLIEWFEGYLDLLFEAGYRVAEYSILNKNIVKGCKTNQVFFIRE